MDIVDRFADGVCDETPALCTDVRIIERKLVTSVASFQRRIGRVDHEPIHCALHHEVHCNTGEMPHPVDVVEVIVPGYILHSIYILYD
jgi:hypothetical protein